MSMAVVVGSYEPSPLRSIVQYYKEIFEMITKTLKLSVKIILQ